MGNALLCGRYLKRRTPNKRIVLLLIGLDNAGKTKTVNCLNGEGDRDVIPTVGFRVVNLMHNKVPVVIYDLGGGAQLRDIWRQYYSDVHGLVFVVDAADRGRLPECKDVLHQVLAHERVAGKPVLILVNKQDIEGAMDDLYIVEQLQIEALVNRHRCPTRVESYSVESSHGKNSNNSLDRGLREGYHWLVNYVSHKYGDLNLRVCTDLNNDQERRNSQNNKKLSSHEAFENTNYRIFERERKDSLNGITIVKEASGESKPRSPAELDRIKAANGQRIKLSPLLRRPNKVEDVKMNPKPVQLGARVTLKQESISDSDIQHQELSAG